MENITQVKRLLSSPKYIVITSHRNPDGDAIGSSLALAHYLNSLGHTTHIVLPSDYPLAFEWMPYGEKMTMWDKDQTEATRVLKSADIVFSLDYNALDRVDKMGEVIYGLRVPKLMIDHHLDPEPFVDFMLSDTTASSTCELVFDFIELLGDKRSITVSIGECIYTGILTDTASFRHGTSPKTFRICAELLNMGVDNTKMQDLIHNSMTDKQLRLLGHCLHNRFEMLPELKTGILSLSKKDYEHFEIQRGDTEGIVNYLLLIKNLKLAAFITEQPNIVKLSLRSKGDFSVQEICRQHFNGGGHKNASGGYSHTNLKNTIQKFKEILPQYQKQLMEEDCGQ